MLACTKVEKEPNFLSTLDTTSYSYKSECGALTGKKGTMIVMKGQKLARNIYKLLRNIVVGENATIESKSVGTLLCICEWGI